jgi:hypothetical protein
MIGLRACAFVCLLAACSSKSDDADEPVFPADYRQSYVEVRSCRPSGDHDLKNVRVLSPASAAGAYVSRTSPFNEGEIVLKEEYDFADPDCSGAVKQWTVMLRSADESPSMLGWRWQRVDAQRHVVEVNAPRCYGCHTACGVAPDGYEGTCGQQ